MLGKASHNRTIECTKAVNLKRYFFFFFDFEINHQQWKLLDHALINFFIKYFNFTFIFNN